MNVSRRVRRWRLQGGDPLRGLSFRLAFAIVLTGAFGASCFPGQPNDETYPLLTAGRAAAPVIDGTIAADEWTGAATAGLLDLGTGLAIREQPVFFLSYDLANLYVAGRIPLVGNARPQAEITQRDGPVWDDDAVEVFVDPSHSHRDYLQFIVNARGTIYDGRGKDGRWNSRATCAARVAKGGWIFELAMPWADLGTATAPVDTAIGLNLCWDRVASETHFATWAPVKGNYHDPQDFGHLVLTAAGPVPRVTSVGRLWSGRWAVYAGATGDGTQSRLGVTVRRDSNGSPLFDRSVAVDSRSAMLEGTAPEANGAPVPGRCSLAYAISAGDRVLARARIPFAVPEYLTLKLYPSKSRLAVTCDAAALTAIGKKPARFDIALMRGGKALRSATMRVPRDHGQVTTAFPTDTLAPGGYVVAIVAQDAAKKTITRQERSFTMPERPAWVGSKEGMAPELPTGWPPVETKGSTIKVSGRQYDFGNGLFLTSCTAKGAGILAGPIEAQVRWRGGRGVLRGKPARVTNKSQERVTLSSAAAAGPFRAEGTIAVEFDGMIRTDLTLTGAKGAALEGLTLRIPIKAAHAKYLYHYPGRWGSAYNAGALPAEGWTHAFKPLVWLGDEDRGFCWFTESDEFWSPYDNERAIEIKRDGNRVVLLLNIIAAQRKLSGPLKYTFGFQATPAKEVTEDVWDFRICHHGGYGIESQPYAAAASVTYPAPGNINLERGTAEMWVTPMFDSNVPLPEDANRGILNQDLFTVPLPGDAMLGFYWNIDDRGMRFFIKDGQQYPLVLSSHSDWKAGEPHHVAVTWGDQVRIYVDGWQLAAADHKGTLARELTGAQIRLGADSSRFVVDELRISDTARTEFDPSAPPAVDEHTLLLDHFNDIETSSGTRYTRPEKSASGASGTLANAAGLIPGRFGNAVRLFAEGGAQQTVLDRLAELGVRTICFHEHWTDIQNYTSTTHGEALRRLVQACHQQGVRLLLYFGYELSDIAPEFPVYSDECLVYPRTGLYTRKPDQTAYIVCYNSVWQDFMAAGIAKMIDEYGIDGVYLDGTANPHLCANREHGCGYVRPDGTLRPTCPFFAVRQMMRRIYNIVKTRKPNGLVNVHQSTCMTIPTLAFATSYWDGEQFGGIEPGGDIFKLLPLDAFRAEFMGRQWGVPAEFLCYNRPYTYDQAMSFTLLHDVLVRGGLGGSLEMESVLWREMDDFGRHEAQWLPYWSNGNVARVEPATCKVSIYNRGALGAVLVASNLGGKEVAAEVALDSAALGLPNAATARDVLSGEEVAWDGKTLRTALKPLSFRVVRLKP